METLMKIKKKFLPEDDEIFFTCNDLEQLNVEMKEKIKAPLFSINENLGKSISSKMQHIVKSIEILIIVLNGMKNTFM